MPLHGRNPIMIEQLCKNCRHWKRMEERATGRVPDDAIRHCTARPPLSDFRWPRTNDNHTCGRWEALPVVEEPLKLEAQPPTGAVVVLKSRKAKA